MNGAFGGMDVVGGRTIIIDAMPAHAPAMLLFAMLRMLLRGWAAYRTLTHARLDYRFSIAGSVGICAFSARCAASRFFLCFAPRAYGAIKHLRFVQPVSDNISVPHAAIFYRRGAAYLARMRGISAYGDRLTVGGW